MKIVVIGLLLFVGGCAKSSEGDLWRVIKYSQEHRK